MYLVWQGWENLGCGREVLCEDQDRTYVVSGLGLRSARGTSGEHRSPADLSQAQEAGPGTRPMVGQSLSVAPQEMLEEARDEGRVEELAALPTPLPGIVGS